MLTLNSGFSGLILASFLTKPMVKVDSLQELSRRPDLRADVFYNSLNLVRRYSEKNRLRIKRKNVNSTYFFCPAEARKIADGRSAFIHTSDWAEFYLQLHSYFNLAISEEKYFPNYATFPVRRKAKNGRKISDM